ncbi:MAG: bifunctional ADP-dependent NAD(P)H-hydrate dehydratase/NAD(P)H-hydrate epimerase [Hydrogenobaculum sp.]|nr:MAG: bifunctional ADP-dependent NAD(P)H-hydrate dehydratase/NAD(P)H-hydrate epimerase [Hydrogenobaculum sp.]
MIYILTPEEMTFADKCTIEKIGIPSLVLMENAAKAVADFVFSLKPQSVLAVVSTGNNGADALACLRWLSQRGVKCDFVVAKSSRTTEEFKIQQAILENLNIKALDGFPKEKYDVIVDGLFGTGFRPPLKEEFVPYVDFINNSSSIVVSVDIPSGIPSDKFVKANYTITFAYPKTYHILYPYSKYAGDIYVKDISIPNVCVPNTSRVLLSIKDVKPLLPKRELDTNKGNEGKVLLIGGNGPYIGAVSMSAKAATMAGAGLVYVGIPKEHMASVSNYLIEQIKMPLPSKDYYIESIENIDLGQFDAVAVGMGFGVYEKGLSTIEHILTSFNKPVLLDADALNIISKYKALELLKNQNIVITPHIGEFSRLSGIAKEDIIRNQIDLSYEFHKQYGCSLVLKGAITTIATESKVYVSARGTPAMAKGGTGDVLSGILSAFLSKMSISKALKLGVFLHGIAGEITAEKSHIEAFSTIDMITNIQEAFKYIEKTKDSEVSYRLHIENM